MRSLIAVAAVVLVAAIPAAAGTAPGCKAWQLSALFREIPGSAGAGSISYAVRLRNHAGACTISGRPGLVLLGRHGRPLPTQTVPDHPGTGTAVLVTIRKHHVARADARFSPDIAGPDEGNPCEPTAYTIRVTLPSPASGTVRGPIHPATAVCQRGRLVLGLLHGG